MGRIFDHCCQPAGQLVGPQGRAEGDRHRGRMVELGGYSAPGLHHQDGARAVGQAVEEHAQTMLHGAHVVRHDHDYCVGPWGDAAA